jgi:subtilisin family serine protease
VDPNHPALQGVLLPGWDFTRNQAGGSEMTDLQAPLTSPPPCTDCPAAVVNQSTAAVLDQSTAAVLDGNPEYAAFGHGTMVMGVIHLVAPQAKLLPLKAFHSDGTAFLSDILSAIYFAVQNQASVINMSFDLKTKSHELSKALDFANQQNVICIASVGNDGAMEIVYPAALQNDVMGVASTSDLDQRSTFSNFGDAIVWVAAPGEAIISTYPFGSYGAAWGTSFSAPFLAGAAALLLDQKPSTNEPQAAAAVAHAVPVGPDMGNGRLDLVQALAANGGQPGDFCIARTHSRKARIHRRHRETFTFKVTALQGFAGTVDLSVTGLPLNTSADFDPPSITGSGSFALTLRIDEDAQPGSYNLTVTGKSGTLVHSVAIELHVR